MVGKPVSNKSFAGGIIKCKSAFIQLIEGQSAEFMFGNDVPRDVPSLVEPTESTGREWKGLRKHGEGG